METAINDFFDGDILFWFYSSLAQVFAALIAIGGVFIVYRLQDQRSKIKDAYEEARAALRDWDKNEEELSKVSDSRLMDVIKRVLDNMAAKNITGTKKDRIVEAKERIELRIFGEEWIRSKRIWPLRLTTLTLMVSMTLIPAHKLLKINSLQYWQLGIFILVLLGSLFSVYLVGRLIKLMIEGEQVHSDLKKGVIHAQERP